MLPRISGATKGAWTDVRFIGPVLGGIILLFLVVSSSFYPEEHNVVAFNAGIEADGNDRLSKQVTEGFRPDEPNLIVSKAGLDADGNGRLNKQVVEDHDVLWQVPGGKPRGLLFVAHGCNHQATDFWPASEDCKECLGLPEEVRICQEALRMGYAVLAVSSIDRQESRCWDVSSNAQQSVDGRAVVAILGRIREHEGLEGLPVYALGASSGGGFVLMLPQLMEVQGVIAQIMGVPTDMFKLPSGRTYPPTLFVHMPRDTVIATMVQRDIKALQSAGVPTAERRIEPRPVTAQFLSSRSPQISEKMAAAMVKALQEGGIVAAAGSGQEGMLLQNPRQTAPEWHALLKDVPGIEKISLVADESPVSELLNVAWAGHEVVSDYTRAGLTWLAAGGKKSFDEVIESDLLLQHGTGG